MGNTICLLQSKSSVFNMNQPVTLFISTRSIDAVIHYNNIIDAYNFASTVLETYVGEKRGEIIPILSVDEVCSTLEKNSNMYVIVDNNIIGITYIYLGHEIHDAIALYNPQIYREKELIRHFQRVGKIENLFN